jgi:hypothetical protein
MFSIYLPEGEPWDSDRRRVVDDDKQISLEFVGTTCSEERGNAFVLSHGDLRIPFHASIDTDPVGAGGGQPFVSWRFVFFGTGMYREQGEGATPYAFGTEEEAARWRWITAEAVLISGTAMTVSGMSPPTNASNLMERY